MSGQLETVIVGGGQAGLAVGYHLSQLGRSFLILDENERTGDSWRTRWDSLQLFTPAYLNALPGLRFPGSQSRAPTKDEMADYLEAYATRFDLPVQTGSRVDSVSRNADRFVVISGKDGFETDNVVLATGGYQAPSYPTSPATLTSASFSSTRATTEDRPSCATATSWWWALQTPARRLRSRPLPRIEHGSRAGTRAANRHAREPWSTGSLPRPSGSSFREWPA